MGVAQSALSASPQEPMVRPLPRTRTQQEQVFTLVVDQSVKLAFLLASTWMTIKMLQRLMNPPDQAAIRAKQDLCRRLGIPANKLHLNQHELAMSVNVVAPDQLDVDLSQVAGCDTIVEAMKRDVLFQLHHPYIAKSALMRSASGVLLYGPPGTGKTMLAKAVAHDAQCVFISIKASSLFSKWLGESNQNTRAIFSLAAKLAAVGALVIVFIDEVDGLLGDTVSTHESSEQVKTEFMQLWDSMSKVNSVVVFAATNRPDRLNDAMWRRFSHHFEVPLPDEEARYAVLRRTLQKHEADGRHNLGMPSSRLIDPRILNDDDIAHPSAPPASSSSNEAPPSPASSAATLSSRESSSASSSKREVPSASQLCRCCRLKESEIAAILSTPTPALKRIAKLTRGYSGSDLVKLCTNAVRLCSVNLYERAAGARDAKDGKNGKDSRDATPSTPRTDPSTLSALIQAHYSPLCEEFLLQSLLVVKAASTTKRSNYTYGSHALGSASRKNIAMDVEQEEGLHAAMNVLQLLDPTTLRNLADLKEGILPQ